MAGPSLYLITRDFTSTEKISDSWYATQALADAAAVAAGEDFSANQGAVVVPDGWEAGWIRNPADDTWRTLDASDLDDLGKRKHAARGLQLALVAIQSAARLMASFRPRRDVQRVATITAMARWANYVVFQNVHDTWTAAQQIAWAVSMAEGARDATDAQAFYQTGHVLRPDAIPAEAFAVGESGRRVPCRSRGCAGAVGGLVRQRRNRSHDGQPRQRRMDRGHHLMRWPVSLERCLPVSRGRWYKRQKPRR